jgi:hypothetical protein
MGRGRYGIGHPQVGFKLWKAEPHGPEILGHGRPSYTERPSYTGRASYTACFLAIRVLISQKTAAPTTRPIERILMALRPSSRWKFARMASPPNQPTRSRIADQTMAAGMSPIRKRLQGRQAAAAANTVAFRRPGTRRAARIPHDP